MSIKTKKTSKIKGQVMMIVVLVLSGIIVSATAIGGLLMVRQTRQTADASASSKSIFASDAGLKWRVYKFIKDSYQCMAEDCSDGGLACDQKPQFETNQGIAVQLVTACTKEKEDANFNYYLLSSTGSTPGSSYVYNEEIRVVK